MKTSDILSDMLYLIHHIQPNEFHSCCFYNKGYIPDGLMSYTPARSELMLKILF